MTEEYLRKYFATLGASSSRLFKSETTKHELLGTYGIGTIGYFIVADKIEVFTRSIESGAHGIKWFFSGGDEYEIEPIEDVPTGTTVLLHLKPQYRALA